jgi:hypothetical protein
MRCLRQKCLQVAIEVKEGRRQYFSRGGRAGLGGVLNDQDPPATDVLLDVNVPFSGGGLPAYLELDKLPDGRYRATGGTLFEYHEL